MYLYRNTAWKERIWDSSIPPSTVFALENAVFEMSFFYATDIFFCFFAWQSLLGHTHYTFVWFFPDVKKMFFTPTQTHKDTHSFFFPKVNKKMFTKEKKTSILFTSGLLVFLCLSWTLSPKRVSVLKCMCVCFVLNHGGVVFIP